MATWVGISYALTGKKDDLQDFEKKIREVEQYVRTYENDEDEDAERVCDNSKLAKLLGSELTSKDLGGYWEYADGESDNLIWKTTDDGEEYLEWFIINKGWENPLTREMIEKAYPGIKIYYQAPNGETNDTDGRYYDAEIKLTQIDGLNYKLCTNRTAWLNADNSIHDKILRVPEQIEYEGLIYKVDRFLDCFVCSEFASPTLPPENVEEIFFPTTIKFIGLELPSMKSLKTIHFAGDVECISEEAFCNCENLETVEFGGKVNEIKSYAFSNTAIKNIRIPKGAKVASDAFNNTPFEKEKKTMIINFASAYHLPDGKSFLCEMQHYLNIYIIIEKPFGEFAYEEVNFDEDSETLIQRLRWIHDNLGDKLLRNVRVGEMTPTDDNALFLKYYSSTEIAITTKHNEDGFYYYECGSVDEARNFLLDNDPEQSKWKYHDNCDLPF